MGVYSFVCRSCDGIWNGNQLHGELKASAESTYELERKLVKQVQSHDPSGEVVQSNFSLISPSSAVFVVIIGGRPNNIAPETKSSSSGTIKRITKTDRNKINSCLKLFENLWLNEAKDKNFAFSPFSIFAVLGLLACGASGKTLEQILEFLNYKYLADLTSASTSLVSELVSSNNGEGPKLCFVNGIWVSNTSTFDPVFKETLRTSFKAETESVDFFMEELARSKVNKWVETKTNGLIKDIIPKDVIHRGVKLIAGNALYFKGMWEPNQFDVSLTKENTFYLLDGRSIQVPFMFTLEDHLFVSCDNDFKVLRLPYYTTFEVADGNKENQSSTQCFSMHIVLPDKRDGLSELIQMVSSDSAGFLDRYLPTSHVAVNRFMLPKFKVLFDFDAIRVLPEMGLVLPFDDNAELDKMLKGENLHVDHVFHKCFVEVDEKGTEAAASTVELEYSMSLFDDDSPPRGIDFVADHPFIFLIREERSGVVLFMGHVLNPLLDS